MELLYILIFWIVMLAIASMISHGKGRGSTGFWLAFLLGPLGVLIILAMADHKKQQEERDRAALRARELKIQKAQLNALQSIQIANLTRTPPPPPAGLWIASNGVELGEMPPETVKTMLQSGRLTPQDLYYNFNVKEWIPLERCPEVY